jgi:hypothetical protein
MPPLTAPDSRRLKISWEGHGHVGFGIPHQRDLVGQDPRRGRTRPYLVGKEASTSKLMCDPDVHRLGRNARLRCRTETDRHRKQAFQQAVVRRERSLAPGVRRPWTGGPGLGDQVIEESPSGLRVWLVRQYWSFRTGVAACYGTCVSGIPLRPRRRWRSCLAASRNSTTSSAGSCNVSRKSTSSTRLTTSTHDPSRSW